MDRNVYIIHGSVIIQDGLSNILRKNFKCTIKCCLSFTAFLKNENINTNNSIMFVEDSIANSDVYLDFLVDSNELKSYSIVSTFAKDIYANNQYSICLYDSHDDIYEIVKHSFKTQEVIQEEDEELTIREIDVLKLVALGFSNKEIAEKLFISIHTVMSHRKNMTVKLGIKSISGLTVYAIINNYIDTTNLDIKDLI